MLLILLNLDRNTGIQPVLAMPSGLICMNINRKENVWYKICKKKIANEKNCACIRNWIVLEFFRKGEEHDEPADKNFGNCDGAQPH